MKKALLILFLVSQICFGQDNITLVLPVGHSFMVENVVLTKSEKTIISHGYDGKIKIWDISSGKLLQTLIGHESTRINGFQLIKNEKISITNN